MILHKFFLLPMILAVGCTAVKSGTSANDNSARTTKIMERSMMPSSDTAVNNLKESKIDRNRLQMTPIRVKNMNPDSIPQP